MKMSRPMIIALIAVIAIVISVIVFAVSGKEAPGSGDAGVTDSADQSSAEVGTVSEAAPADTASERAATDDTAVQSEGNITTDTGAEEELTLKMTIAGTEVTVDWEDNASVEALRELCKNGELTIDMSMYGGFEQVGPIGTVLPSDDVETTTSSGDIVLYSSDQLVVFYGSNSWQYTRLGHITDSSGLSMEQLLGGGDVSVTLGLK